MRTHPSGHLNSRVDGESWTSFFTVTLGTWMAVWFFAAVHNQYLIRIAPEHFTVWHYRIPFIQDYTLLGIAYAFGASASPGVVLGMALFILGRLGSRPKTSPLRLVLSTAWVWLGVEIVAITAGIMVHLTARPLYPEWVYPDDSHGLLITQTIQITAYLLGAGFSTALLIFTWWSRGRKLPV